MNPSLREVLIFSSTLTLSATLFYPLFGPLCFIPIGVTLSHELGHYFAARQTTASEIRLPIFFPIPPLLLGTTYVQGEYNQALVAYAGPVIGSFTALICAVGSLIIGSQPALLVSLSLLLVQLSSLYFSSDAKKARKWLRKQNKI